MTETEIERLTRELKICEDRYRSLMETSVDAIVTTDDRDRILTWNKGAQHLFGHGPEIVGQPVERIIPERYQKAHQDGMKRFLKTGRKQIIGQTVELQALRKDGTEVPVELSLSTWKGDGRPIFGAIIRDISARKQVEQMRENVERMMRHELRSPLIGITGLARILHKEPGLSPKQQKSLDLIQSLGEKTLKHIDRSRDLFQMEQGVYKLSPRPVDLVRILKAVVAELDPLLQKKGVRTELKLSGKTVNWDATYEVQGDEGLLEMLFANLLKNAIEASPDKETVHIAITSRQKDGKPYHHIDIHNQGTIPQDIRPVFFDPYTTSGKKGGSGLGTHCALLVVRNHQGDIHFTTSEKEGTHMVVELPHEIPTGT